MWEIDGKCWKLTEKLCRILEKSRNLSEIMNKNKQELNCFYTESKRKNTLLMT